MVAAAACEATLVVATPAGATELAAGTTAELAAIGATLAAEEATALVDDAAVEPVEEDALEVVPSAETVTFSAAVPKYECDQHELNRDGSIRKRGCTHC